MDIYVHVISENKVKSECCLVGAWIFGVLFFEKCYVNPIYMRSDFVW